MIAESSRFSTIRESVWIESAPKKKAKAGDHLCASVISMGTRCGSQRFPHNVGEAALPPHCGGPMRHSCEPKEISRCFFSDEERRLLVAYGTYGTK